MKVVLKPNDVAAEYMPLSTRSKQIQQTSLKLQSLKHSRQTSFVTQEQVKSAVALKVSP